MLVILTGYYRCILSRIQGCLLMPERKAYAQGALFMLGTALLTIWLTDYAWAYSARIESETNAVLTYLEGSFGALFMVTAGAGSIISLILRKYRASLLLIIIAIATFIIRAYTSSFFNDSILP